jgi:hypothetical protein
MHHPSYILLKQYVHKSKESKQDGFEMKQHQKPTYNKGRDLKPTSNQRMLFSSLINLLM